MFSHVVVDESGTGLYTGRSYLTRRGVPSTEGQEELDDVTAPSSARVWARYVLSRRVCAWNAFALGLGSASKPKHCFQWIQQRLAHSTGFALHCGAIRTAFAVQYDGCARNPSALLQHCGRDTRLQHCPAAGMRCDAMRCDAEDLQALLQEGVSRNSSSLERAKTDVSSLGDTRAGGVK